MASTMMDRMAGVRGVLVQGAPADGFGQFAPEAARGRVRRITEVGEAVLGRRCRPVERFGTPELSRLIDDLFITMYVAEGAGLAANQVGEDLRLFVYDCLDEDRVRHVGHIVNPVLEPPEHGRGLVEEPEGCLSVPGVHCELARADHAVVRGFDRDGDPLEIEGSGYFARCLHHETDHLDGMLYVDRLPAARRRAVLKHMREVRDSVYEVRRTRAAELGADGADGQLRA